MPYSQLVLTAGISSLAPRNFLGAILRQPDSPVVFPPGKQNPEPRDTSLDEDQLETACRDFIAQPSSPPAPATPETISAEFSLLHRLREEKRLAPGAMVYLIHTPTLGGRLAVRLQLPLLESRLGVQVHAEELSVPFDPAQPGGLALASGAFIGTVSRLLCHADPHSTAFAPIGGYKVMVSLGHTAASFHGFSSLYLHEDSQVLQEIAPAPLAIPAEVRKDLEPLARKVGNGAAWGELTSEDHHLIEAHPAFFTRVDDLVELNELGQFLRLDSLPILLSPEAHAEFLRQPAILRPQLLQLADIAATTPEHKGINHDLVSNTGRNHPWRLARMGLGIRIAWQIRDMQKEGLLIGYIWRDHDTYNDEATRWVTTPLPDHTAKFVSIR